MPVYLVEVAGSNEPTYARWLLEVMRYNYIDLRPWFPEGAAALQREEVRQKMAHLGESLWNRLQRSRRVEAVPGNFPRLNPHFVGRREELRKLHEQLALGSVGVVTAVHGLGGLGKTELAVAYAHGFADSYPAGLWRLDADGKVELLPLIGELAWVPTFGLSPTEAEKADPNLLGLRVLAHLKQRATNAACLLLLDNVTEPALLSASQLDKLPKDALLRILATTRLDLPTQKDRLAVITIDALDEDSALSLIRDLQPARNARREIVTDLSEGRPEFVSESEEAAAREIVRELGGFSLAVEQVAHYLGLHPEVPPSAFLATLRQKSLTAADSIPRHNENVAVQLRTPSKQLGLILDVTQAQLDEPARTALQFASLLPPDTVPWPWLRSLTVSQHPELREKDNLGADPWLSLQRRLTGLRLIIPGDHPEIGRVHRLVAAHLAESIDADTCRHLDQWLELRTDAVAQAHTAPADWELDALCAALPHVLAHRPGRGLAASAADLSGLAKYYGSVSAAESLMRCGHTVLERLAAENPSDAGCQRDLSISLNRLGDFAVAQGDLTRALRCFTQSKTIREQLAFSDPANLALQRDLSVALNNLGDLSVAQGDLAGALRSFSESRAIVQRLAATDPGNAAWLRDCSVLLNKLGDLAVAQGDLAGALHSFADARAITERLAASNPTNAEWQRDLSVALNRLADIAIAQGDANNAQRQLFNAKAISERLAASDPANAAWQRDLVVSLSKLGHVATVMGNLAEAQRHFEECHAINERLAANDPANAAWQRDLSVSLHKLGDLASAQGDIARATAFFRKCVAIAERLAASDPANAAWQRDLAVSYDRLGVSAQSRGDHHEAEDWLTRAKMIKERLAASDPSNASWQRDLVATHIQMAGVAQDQRNQEKFTSHIQDSYDLLHRMKQSGQVLDPHMEQLYQKLSRMNSTDTFSGSGPVPGS